MHLMLPRLAEALAACWERYWAHKMRWSFRSPDGGTVEVVVISGSAGDVARAESMARALRRSGYVEVTAPAYF